MPNSYQPDLVDRSLAKPLHRQLKEILLNQIESGKIPVNSKIPSERNLVETYGVSRITVRQAIAAIVQEGFVQSQPGKGFYVTERKPGYEYHLLKSFSATAMERGLSPGSALISGSIGGAENAITHALRLADGAPVVSLKRLRTLDGYPVAVQEDWLIPSMVPSVLELDWSSGNRSLYHELRSRFGVDPQHGQTIVGARLVTEFEAELLEMQLPSAVLTLEQIAFDERMRPVNFSRITQDAVRYPIFLHQGEDPST